MTEAGSMTTLNNNKGILDRFEKAVLQAFPDADVDEMDDELWCSYSDIGFRVYISEDQELMVIVQFPVPVVAEAELPDEWFNFEMNFSSERLAGIARNTLLSIDHGWEEEFQPSLGCPVDDIEFTFGIKVEKLEQGIEQVIEDLKNFFNEVRVRDITNMENAARAWFLAKCKQLGLKSSWDFPIALEARHDDLIGIDRCMLAGPGDEILPSEYQSGRWFLLASKQLAAGERFCFIVVNNNYYAFDNYLISLARHVLSLAMEPIQQISQTYEWRWEFHEKRALRVQLKSRSKFSPWFLISPYDFSSARALESGEPLITQRTGLLRAALGESKVPTIDFKSMSDDEFEEFCSGLLIAQGATEVERRGMSKSRDSGVDISCNFEIPLFGKRKTLVQCKKMNRSFGKSDYNKLNYHELLRANDAVAFIVMCSSEPTKDVLDLVHASDGKLQVMGNTRLRGEVAKYPEILSKYRTGKARSVDN